MKIILIHPDFDKADLIAAHLQTEIECDCIIQTSASAGLMLLDMTPDCNAIILYDPENPKDSKKLITKAKQSNKLHILHLTLQPEHEQLHYADDLQQLIPILLQHLPIPKKQEPDYHRIHIDHLRYLQELPVEISLFLNNKYITILKKGDPLTKQLIEKYKYRNVRYVYLRNYDRTLFQQLLAKRYQQLLHTTEQQDYSVEKIQQGVFDLLIDFGLNEEITKLAKDATEQILDQIASNPNLKEQLKELYSKHASFRFKLNYMTSMLAYSMISDSKNVWVTEQHKTAIIYASMFNDVTLKKEQWILFRCAQDLPEDLSTQEEETIMQHALASTQKHQNIKEIPPEALKIIMQHHGKLNGIGFSRSLTGPTALHPLTYFFIVAEEFAIKVLTAKEKKVNIPSLLNIIQKEYAHKKINNVLHILKEQLR